jgi:hypothetical protein
MFSFETTDKILKQKLLTLIYTFLMEENAVLVTKIQSAASERKDSCLLTYLLTPWTTVLLEQLTGFAASQEIPRIL